MGAFHVCYEVENVADRSMSAILAKIPVDTGSQYTWVIESVLEKMEIPREKKRITFVMANGKPIGRDIGFAIVRVGEIFTIDEVVFAEPGDPVLLGARALAGLNLKVDRALGRLVSNGPILAA